MKESFVDWEDQKRTVLDQLFYTFDRDCDGLISSHDFVETLRSLDSETIMRAKSRDIH
jgi:Ca2+-binding EF-hand superfamily protein